LTGRLAPAVRQYLIVTANYWTFTLTDGALRMLVVLHFHQLGYSPLAIAMLFLFYEFFGVVTNLIGGWLGARIGLNRTMNIGLGLQVIALSMLLVPQELLIIPWVMAAQAMSGIAKDLNKMSAKSAIKLLVPADAQGKLFRWVALLTGSKNALKGVGFFLGGALLVSLGFQQAIGVMAAALALVWLTSMFSLKDTFGKARDKPKFSRIFSKSHAVNTLSAARLFLFGARDVWFVVALPVYLSASLDWSHEYVGGFLALWIIGYGAVQSMAPMFASLNSAGVADGRRVAGWTASLSLIPALIAVALLAGFEPEITLISGLLVFGALFAINSSLHSFLIVSYADADGVSLDVGFYYMANAMGRLIGTILSGWVFQSYGLAACLFVSSAFLGVAVVISVLLPAGAGLAMQNSEGPSR
jgi:predicted MFS family arabinose efflux permease